MDRGAWWAIVHEVTKSRINLATKHTHIHRWQRLYLVLHTTVPPRVTQVPGTYGAQI